MNATKSEKRTFRRVCVFVCKTLASVDEAY